MSVSAPTSEQSLRAYVGALSDTVHCGDVVHTAATNVQARFHLPDTLHLHCRTIESTLRTKLQSLYMRLSSEDIPRASVAAKRKLKEYCALFSFSACAAGIPEFNAWSETKKEALALYAIRVIDAVFRQVRPRIRIAPRPADINLPPVQPLDLSGDGIELPTSLSQPTLTRS